MASSAKSEAVKEALQHFVLKDVKLTGRQLGTGSYGSVEEVEYRNLVCAGKKLHEILVEPGNLGVGVIVGKYLEECLLMSSLSHPNIAPFLGLCFQPKSRLPLLVMERLETNLDSFLEFMPKFSIGLKICLLKDVACGLLYLHKRQPSIIHRDLTAKNVLLTSSLVAKITDMGNSRIIDMRSDRMAQTLSKLPGTLVYMPPEATDAAHCYGTPLDIFSFGHLAIYTITQVFPGDLLPSTYPDPDNTDDVQARTELERRKPHVEMMEAEIGRAHQAFLQLVKRCLSNAPLQRPGTAELHTWLERRAQMEEKSEELKLEQLCLVEEMKIRLDTKWPGKKEMKESEFEKELERMSKEIKELESRKRKKSKQLGEGIWSSQLQQRKNILQAFKAQHDRARISTTKLQTLSLKGQVYEQIFPQTPTSSVRGRSPSAFSGLPEHVHMPASAGNGQRRFTLASPQPQQAERIIGDLQSQSWYWGNIDKNTVMEFMQGKPDGAFLVRDSQDAEYALVVQKGGSSRSIRITSSDGVWGLADLRLSADEPVLGNFSSVVALVDYFRHTSLVKYNKSFDVVLMHPVSRFELTNSDEDVEDWPTPDSMVKQVVSEDAETESSDDDDDDEDDSVFSSRRNIMTWFCRVDRSESMAMLRGKPEGTFLCRPTSKPAILPDGALHTFTVDVMCKDVRHIKVLEEDGRFGFSTPCTHPSLTDLVSYYATRPLTTFNPDLNVALKFPVKAQTA